VAPRFAILNPCSKRWSELTGEGRERFCGDCQTQVHAIDQYSAAELADLRRNSLGRLCGYLVGESPSPPRSRRAVLIGVALTAISPLMAQSGRVRIRVIDSTGAVVPLHPEAALIDKDGNAILSARANEAGEIVLTRLPIGDSRIRVTCAGFTHLTLIVTIRNGDELKVDAPLQLGTTGTAIEVERPPAIWPEPTRDDLNSMPAPQTVVLAPPEPADLIPPAKKKRKGWWIFRTASSKES
jgi:hypothetical protein